MSIERSQDIYKGLVFAEMKHLAFPTLDFLTIPHENYSWFLSKFAQSHLQEHPPVQACTASL